MTGDGLVHKLAKKKELGQYPTILTEQTWSIKDLLYMAVGRFFLRDTAGSPEWARWLHLARSVSQSQRTIWVILLTHGASHIITYVKIDGFTLAVASWVISVTL